MSTYGWVVDTDHIDTGAAGTRGPSDIPDQAVEQLDRGEGMRWRVRDDDGELYYSGRLVLSGGRSDGYDSEMFGPLDDFGAPNAGAVTIEYQNKTGEWEVL
jgi:hypothetical protein